MTPIDQKHYSRDQACSLSPEKLNTYTCLYFQGLQLPKNLTGRLPKGNHLLHSDSCCTNPELPSETAVQTRLVNSN